MRIDCFEAAVTLPFMPESYPHKLFLSPGNTGVEFFGGWDHLFEELLGNWIFGFGIRSEGGVLEHAHAADARSVGGLDELVGWVRFSCRIDAR